MLSKFRLLHSVLPHLSPIPSSSLPTLLSTLKANMAVGLPGHSKSISVPAVQPLLPVSSLSPSRKSRPMHSVAGPQDRRGQGKGGKNRKAKSRSKGDSADKISSDDASIQSSDSESNLSSASEGNLTSQWSVHRQDKLRGRNWERGLGSQEWGRRKVGSSSESEVSDSDGGCSSKLKTVQSKIRHHALSCLAILFQVCLLCRH